MPQPVEIYHKGDFKGIFCCKFNNVSDRDQVVESMRRLKLKIQNEKVWSAEDLPIDVRVPEHFLFGLKKLLEAWGYDRQDIWVNTDTKSISLGKELILSITLNNLNMQLTYGPFWEGHIKGDAEFTKLFEDEQDKLDRSVKGSGKGKKGKVGPSGPTNQS